MSRKLPVHFLCAFVLLPVLVELSSWGAHDHPGSPVGLVVPFARLYAVAPPSPEPHPRDQVEAARTQWEQRQQEFLTGKVSPEVVLEVSRTLAEAEQIANDSPAGRREAREAHFRRVAALEKACTGIREAGRVTNNNEIELRRGRQIAEMWLAQAILLEAHPDASHLTPEEMAACWSDLLSGETLVAYRAMSALVRSAEDSVPFLSRHLKPCRPMSQSRLDGYLARMDSNNYLERLQATEELRELGPPVEKPLLALAEQPVSSLEVRKRIDFVLDSLPGVQMRQARALQVLEQMRTREALTLLGELAKGSTRFQLTKDARDAVKALHHLETDAKAEAP